jgi:hypothetical protein
VVLVQHSGRKPAEKAKTALSLFLQPSVGISGEKNTHTNTHTHFVVRRIGKSMRNKKLTTNLGNQCYGGSPETSGF